MSEEAQDKEAAPALQEGGAMGFWHRYRLLIILAVLGLVIIGWLAVSKEAALKQAREESASQRAELIKAADAQHAATVKASLQMFCVPLAWAIRREMMAENLDQVDQYVTDLVKQKGFERVVVAKADGVVAVASDRKNLGAAFSSLYPARFLSNERISVEETAPGKWLAVIPVMGLASRLGTVAIEYQAPPSTLGK
jgi:hypothetical protein